MREVEEGWLDAEVDARGAEVECESQPLSFNRDIQQQESIRALAGERWRKIWLKLSWVRSDVIKQEGYRDAARTDAELTMLEHRLQPLPPHLRPGFFPKAVIRSCFLLAITGLWAYVIAVSFAASFPGKNIPSWLQIF